MSDGPRSEWETRLRTLLSEALAYEPDGRAAFLDKACADNPGLRAELESLLADGPFDALASALSTLTRKMGEADLGRRLGPFRIVRVLGYGGMGAVYLGERVDGQFEQRVALKIIRSGHGGDEVRRRFFEERQILARLEHEHIARLLDGGITEEGEPYFAMEYVEGESIDGYCDARQLELDGRLKLFLQVCGAVQHAHQSLVVHRDLKPSNILVTPSGQVKLLDFGIAKLLPGDASSSATQLTQPRIRWLTPEYAAPELVRGEPITTAADVYTLGVVLYELLAGRSPYRIDHTSAAEMERAVCETEPERPSAALARTDATGPTAEQISRARSIQPPQLRRQLQGDLDTIVLHALRKEPARRYGSVAELAEDIERHLRGLPVKARPATLSYRASKFVRRQRAALAAVTSIIVLLVAGIIGTSTQAVRAEEEAQLARQQAAKAERVSRFLTSLFNEANPERAHPAADRTAREILDRGAAWVKDSLAHEPEVQATMMNLIGSIYHRLGLLERAQSQHEGALEIWRRLHHEESTEVARAMNDVALVVQGRGNYARAESLYQRALAIHRKTTVGDNEYTETLISNLALLRQIRGELETAEKMYEEALVLSRRLRGNHDAHTARVLNNLGSVKRMRGDYDGAEPPLREALAIKLELLGRENTSTANTLNQLGVVQHARGEYASAEAYYREALAIRKRLVGDTASIIGINLNDLANLYRDQQRYTQADSAAREALRIVRTNLGDRHGNVGAITGTLAAVKHASGNPRAAEPLYRQAIANMRAGLSSTHPEVGNALLGLGVLLLERGDARAAQPLLREALSIRNQKLRSGDWKIAEAENALGACLSALGRSAEANSLLVRSSETIRAAQGVPPLQRRRAGDFLAAHYERTGQSTKAAR